jgi:hypothetical protein
MMYLSKPHFTLALAEVVAELLVSSIVSSYLEFSHIIKTSGGTG